MQEFNLIERVAKAIHEARSDIPWSITINQDVAYRDARAALSASGLEALQARVEVLTGALSAVRANGGLSPYQLLLIDNALKQESGDTLDEKGEG